MRILCPIHGASEVVQLSPDYQIASHEDFIKSAKVVSFEYLSKSIDRYILSAHFSCSHDINAGKYVLPDEYPLWTNLIKIECRKCFEDRNKNADPPDITCVH
jgi:hypothetical protein